FAVAVNPAGNFAYVTNISTSNVSVIDTNTNTVVATVPSGLSPFGVAVNPAGTFAYVTNRDSDLVSILNTATNTVVASVAVGHSPIGMGQFVNFVGENVSAFVPNALSGTVSVIRLPVIDSPVVKFVSTTGDINVATNAGSAPVTANTGGA